ncbi:hypothetical protein NQ318_013690 [Aromia moschata]|uniref:Uncharacterized protein n=1 Tax=Aromia moschata TaxID=1265417 RepID=A0AAV8Z8A3_9CUCU|nr:hypothetical protein NQ318_013690 [Aromia moschata]
MNFKNLLPKSPGNRALTLPKAYHVEVAGSDLRFLHTVCVCVCDLPPKQVRMNQGSKRDWVINFNLCKKRKSYRATSTWYALGNSNADGINFNVWFPSNVFIIDAVILSPVLDIDSSFIRTSSGCVLERADLKRVYAQNHTFFFTGNLKPQASGFWKSEKEGGLLSASAPRPHSLCLLGYLRISKGWAIYWFLLELSVISTLSTLTRLTKSKTKSQNTLPIWIAEK